MNKRILVLALLAGFFGGIAGTIILGWTYTYDVATPGTGDDPKEGDDRIREIKAALQERLAIDHVFALTDTEVSDANAGKHHQVTLFDVSNTDSDPTLDIVAYSGVYELIYNDPCSNVVQLTSGGVTYIGPNAVDSNMILDVTTTEITDGTILAVDLDSGANNFCDDATLEIDGTVGLRVKAGGVGLTQLAAAAKFSPSSYAGEESVTFPNGLIMKYGTGESSPGVQSSKYITFASAFPTAIVYASISFYNSADGINGMDSPYLRSWSTTQLRIHRHNGGGFPFNWFALGY